MKNVRISASAFILLAVLLTQVGCSKNTIAPLTTTEQVLIRNAWSIDYYFNAQDMTESYTRSRLLFSNTGAVGYQKDGKTIAGKWSRTVDAGNNELIDLQFNTIDANIMELNKSWKLTNRTDNSIQFEDKDGNTDVLFRLKTQ